MPPSDPLFTPLELPCGAVLKNRLAKAAMSDSLGDGAGRPTARQSRLYERWAEGGLGLSIIGEVQTRPDFPEKPGNLVLQDGTPPGPFQDLTRRGSSGGTQLWPQLGHAGALAFAPLSRLAGPSALDLPGLKCRELSIAEIQEIPGEFAKAASLAKSYGFTGIEIHAAHGFLLSQFLSPLFNRRGDAYGGSASARARLVLEVIAAVRDAVGPTFPLGIKINATDYLEGGVTTTEALTLVDALETSSIDLIDTSGGTYFPGAKAASDGRSKGAYFRDFTRAAKTRTKKPIMLTGGIKTWEEAADILSDDSADVIGLARSLVIDPSLPKSWAQSPPRNPAFPRFDNPPDGGITAWYTMRLTQIAEDRDAEPPMDIPDAIDAYDGRDKDRIPVWRERFPLSDS